MAKPELGTKRLCGSCGAKFYDLAKDPIVCPKCETVFHPVVYATRGRPGAAAAAAAAAAAPLAPAAAEAPESADVELVSLEEADAEGSGKGSKKKLGSSDVDATEDDDDVVVADDGEEDDTFLETDDEEGDDVSDIVGGDREDQEDT